MEVCRKMAGEKANLNFEETELRLGLPGGRGGADHQGHKVMMTKITNGKGGFEETVDLKLNDLSSVNKAVTDMDPSEKVNISSMEKTSASSNDTARPHAKAQVVGWPPVRSFRKNILSVQKRSSISEEMDKKQQLSMSNINAANFVKVSMDGAPYLRKVDLK